MLLTHTNISFVWWWREGLSALTNFTLSPLSMSHKSVITHKNTRCFRNMTLSLTWFPRTTSFTASRSLKLYYKSQAALPSSHLKLGPGTLSKVIKEWVMSQNQPFPLEVSYLPSLSLPHSSSMILLCWGHSTSPQRPHASPVSRVVFSLSKHFILFNEPTKCPNWPTCPCMGGLWFAMIIY